jgi:hypothetical protein
MKILEFVLDTMIAYFCAVILLIPIANVFYFRILKEYWLDSHAHREHLRKKALRIRK